MKEKETSSAQYKLAEEPFQRREILKPTSDSTQEKSLTSARYLAAMLDSPLRVI
jgi:hypothetical protein